MNADDDETILNDSDGNADSGAGRPVGGSVGDLPSGTRLGDYELEKLLGAGAMGEVYLARQVRLDQRCAVKVLPQALTRSADFEKRFESEGRSLAKLDHPNIVRVFNAGEDKGRHFLTMEYVEGGSLEDYLVRRGGKLPESEVRVILAEILSGLVYAHKKNVVHRDLKPANILRTGDGQCKIGDFGLALVAGEDFFQSVVQKSVLASQLKGNGDKTEPTEGNDLWGKLRRFIARPSRKAKNEPKNLSDDDTLLESDVRRPFSSNGVAAFAGTLDYMSPEVRDGGEADARSDLYSLGVLAYLMLTGKKPRGGRAKEPSKIVPDLSAKWDDWVFRCLESEPEERFQSADEALASLSNEKGGRGRLRTRSFIIEPEKKTPTHEKIIQRVLPDFQSNEVSTKETSHPSVVDKKDHCDVDDKPFICLGYDHGSFFYLPNRAEQVVELETKEHTIANLLQLADLSWWKAHYGDENDKIDIGAIRNALFGWCYERGVYTDEKLRGRGCWLERGKLVFHAGDRLYVDGIETSLYGFECDHVFERGDMVLPEAASPLEDEDAGRFLELCKSFSWDRSISGQLLAGWCALAPISGVLECKPHIWINGPERGKKSWIFDKMVSNILGHYCCQVQPDSTVAGLRRLIRFDALPILCQEKESGDKRSLDRIQAFLGFMRACSSRTHAIHAKSAVDGRGKSFQPKTCICFASVDLAEEGENTDAVTSLKLADEHELKTVETVQRDLWAATVQDPNWCAGFRARSFAVAQVIARNAIVFSHALEGVLSEKGECEQKGALLAGAYSLTSRTELSLEEAIDWVKNLMLIENVSDSKRTEEWECLKVLMNADIRLDGAKGQEIHSVMELIKIFIDEGTDIVLREKANEALLRNGVRVIANGACGAVIYVASTATHPLLAKIFVNTPFSDKWKNYLLKLPGAQQMSGARFAAW